MAVANEHGEEERPQQGSVLAYRRGINYPHLGEMRVPDAPLTDIQPTGFFGWGADPQVVAHNHRLRALYQQGVEASYGERVAIAAEVEGIRHVTEGVGHMEQIVYSLAPNTIAGMVAADLTSESTARSRGRHGRWMDALDAEMLNTFHKR